MRRFTALIHIEVDDNATKAQVIEALDRDCVKLDLDTEDNYPEPICGLLIEHNSVTEWDDEIGGVVVYQP